jgi:serine/threonine protein kinase
VDSFWVRAVQSDRFNRAVEEFLLSHVHMAGELATMKDSADRVVTAIASPLCKKTIMKFLYFYRRYEITTLNQPHHQSATCILHLAIDHEDNDRPVALKLMKLRENFLRETEARERGQFDEDYVVGIIRWHDGDIDEKYREEVRRKGFPIGKYCIVMDAGERNLNNIIEKERIAGVQWDQIRALTIQIARAVGHMHEKGYIHGDIKRKYSTKYFIIINEF